jgi:hypothetical protein
MRFPLLVAEIQCFVVLLETLEEGWDIQSVPIQWLDGHSQVFLGWWLLLTLQRGFDIFNK